MIETLNKSNQADFVETIAVAFSDHPMMPPGLSGQKTRLMVTSMLKTFANAPDARLFGIRREGNLDCAALVYDAAYEPRGWRLIIFLIQMFRVFGWNMSRTFARVLSEKPAGEGRQLELLLLGTRKEAQGQGLGRAMLRHIFEVARDLCYDSVVLEVAKETPAHAFYLREGFKVDKEISMPTNTLCFLRRPIAKNDPDGDSNVDADHLQL